MIVSPHRSLTLALGICLIAAGLPAQAQWKWKDARGQVQYSDLPPPPGTPATNILLKPYSAPTPVLAPASAASAPSASASAVDPVLEAKRKQADQQEADKRKADEARVAQSKVQNCDRARAYMRSLDSGQRIARSNAQGEREVLDDRARAQEVEQTRRVMASECN